MRDNKKRQIISYRLKKQVWEGNFDHNNKNYIIENKMNGYNIKLILFNIFVGG
jgi:ATP-dependent RNA circularization protein (DNA/RNA ligase family)